MSPLLDTATLDHANPASNVIDAGLNCLALLMRFHGLAADPADLTHAAGLGANNISSDDLIRLTRRQGLKARIIRSRSWACLPATPLSAIAGCRDGGFVVLAQFGENKVLIQHGRTMRPEIVARVEFEALWDGTHDDLIHRAGRYAAPASIRIGRTR